MANLEELTANENKAPKNPIVSRTVATSRMAREQTRKNMEGLDLIRAKLDNKLINR